MSFSYPWLLLLLGALPLIFWLGGLRAAPAGGAEIISLALRLLIALLLILGLAGLELRRAADELSVVYLVDHSDSMPPAAQQVALDYVRQALQEMGPNDQSAVIVFGGEALVERPLSASKDAGRLHLQGHQPSRPTWPRPFAWAWRCCRPTRPGAWSSSPMGSQTTGDALEAARLAAASGVQIVVVPFVDRSGAEAIVTDVSAPAHLREGEQFGLEVTDRLQRRPDRGRARAGRRRDRPTKARSSCGAAPTPTPCR